MARRTAVSFALVVCASCLSEPSIDLIELERVEPDVIEPGATVAIHGTGFPIGPDGVLRLEGTLRSPGRTPRVVSFETTVRAVEPDRLSFVATDPILQAIGGRGTFRGKLEVTFAATGHQSRITGSVVDAQLDFRSDAHDDLRGARDQARVALRTASDFGLTLAETSDDGITIEEVREGSVSDASGLRSGDRLLEVNGVRLAGAYEILPTPGASEVELLVRRQGRASPWTVNLARRSTSSFAESLPASWVSVVAVLLLFLMFLSPGAVLFSWFVRAIANRPDPGKPRVSLSRFLLAEPRVDVAKSAPRRPGALIVACAIATAAFATLSWSSMRWPHGPHAGVLLVLALIAQVIPASSGTSGSTGRELMTILGRAISLVASVLSISLLRGGWSLPTLVEGQGPWPWQWTLFTTPVGFCAFMLFVSSAVVWMNDMDDAHSSSVAKIAARVNLFVIGSLAASVFLGGARITEGLPSGVGHAVFVVKAWCVAALCVRLRESMRTNAPQSIGLRIAFVFASSGLIAGTLAWTWLRVPDAVPEILTVLLIAAVMLIAGIALRAGLAKHGGKSLKLDVHPLV